jgi:serine/threonine protein kinase/Tol biopolymer transport system component
MSAMPPSPDWSEFASLVDVLLDVPPDGRASLIEALSAGDPVRRAQLERLREQCEREPTLLSRPAAERFPALLDDDDAGFPPSLSARYRVARELGRGGMATVYLARDLKHDREVAVKVVHPSVASALGPERFLREIAIAAQLHHPHIVQLYDSGEADGNLYYVMPYEAGLSLRQRLACDGALPLDDAVVILRDVCDALAHAHGRGIIHRDIKPDNVLLSDRHAMVTDFGVARAATDATARDARTATGMVLGTPAYMAPEQIGADPGIDHRADLYAVGVLGYELLAGQPPFTHDTPQAVLAAHLTRTPVPVSTHRPDLPAPLAELVMKCLEKRPDDRWQTAAEMVARLDALPIARGGTATFSLPRRRWTRVAATAGVLGLAAVAVVARPWRANPAVQWRDRWSSARIERLTDFAGSEVDAAISANGQFVAFLADHDSVFDAFVGQVGSGQFLNLTGGRLQQLYNEDVRNIGFTADAAHAWIRVADLTSPASVSLAPTLGGPLRPFLGTAVMAAWSPDGARIAYHETSTGDPIYVADADGGNPRRLFVGGPGVHSHYLSWSPDGRFLYFAHGVPPDEMDVWRIASSGGAPERMTHLGARVAYPVLLDDRTLLFTATAEDATGPWLYMMDLGDRAPQRLSTGVEHYLSIAASAEVPGQPRRLVAAVSNPAVQLWTVPIVDSVAGEAAASAIAFPTARSAAPRFGADSSIFYLASRSGADGVWRRSGVGASEFWKPGEGAAVVGAAAISPDGGRVCFPVRRQGRTTLHCTTAEGTGVRLLAESLDVRGAPSWSPDGKWIAVGAVDGSGVRVFMVPADGGAPIRLVDSASSNPVWSPDGRFILYSGTPRGRSVPLEAVTPDRRPVPLPPLLVDRVGDSYRFFPGGKQLVVKLGGFRRQDFWLFDVTNWQRRRLTRLRPGESLRRFDVSPDGQQLVFERVRENSDVVLIELGR